MNVQNKKKLAYAVFSLFAMFDFLLMLMVTPISVGASAQCVLNPQHGWHIVGGGQDNNHWYDTQDECLADLNPTEEPTVTSEPTDVPTEEPTITAEPTDLPTDVPTDLPTDEPTVTPDPTETVTVTPEPTTTVSPTDLPTEEPTETPVVTETPSPTTVPTEVAPSPTKQGHILPTPAYRRTGLNCARAWYQISHNIYKDVGYRFFDNPEHAYCKVWLMNTYSIDYGYYKLMHP